MADGGKKKKDGDENRYMRQMLGPLAGGSSGRWEIGRLRTRGVREIGRFGGPGVRAKFRFTATGPFFPAKSKQNGVRKCSGPRKLLCADPFGTLWPKLVRRTPHFPRFLRFSAEFPRDLLCPGDPPRELSAFYPTAERGGFRGPCFGEMRRSGNREIWQRTEGGKITGDKGGRFHKKGERRQMTEGERGQ